MSFVHKHLPHYTYADYCQWEGNWELIDGIPYAMSPPPAPLHQYIVNNLGAIFRNALKSSFAECKTYQFLDWKIADDIVLQPDLLIICGEVTKSYLDFTPALVVEILSPSTAIKDRNIKKEIYRSQGLKYYLIIDTQSQRTEIYELAGSEYIPVSISPETFSFTFDNNCTIEVDIADIWH